MGLTNEHVGHKLLAKIKIYVLTRAELLFPLCYEIPCTIFFKNEDNVRHPAFSVLQKLSHYSCSIFLSILLYFLPPKSFQREVFVFRFQRLFTYSESLLSWEWTKDLLGAL